MANRVDYDDVKVIIDTDVSDANITTYITAAHALMADVFGTGDATATLLIEIEKWLAAHMIAMSQTRQGEMEKVGDAQIKYTGQYGELLKMTSYGQMAMTLDTSGKLAKMGKQVASTYAVTSFS